MAKTITEQQKKIILVSLISLVILYVDFSFILKTQINSLSSVSNSVRQARSGIIQYKKDALDLKRLEADYNSLKDRSAQIESKIIPDSDIPVLLDDISQKANLVGIKIMQMKPIREKMEEDKNMKGSNTTAKFFSLPIQLDISSGYHQLGAFLSSLEDNPLLGVNGVKIRFDENYPLRHRVELSLKAYVTKK